MKLTTITFKNLIYHTSFYSLYLFSISFVLMIYFCFLSFSLNKVIIEKISSDGRVENMCRTVTLFIMAFVIFYMFYSNHFFMCRRMKELGIYTLLGWHKSRILKLLLLENSMICFGSMIIGILTGAFLHKAITSGIIALLGLSIDTSAIPFIHQKAVQSILLFILVVLFSITLSNIRLLYQSSLLDLIRLEKKIEKPIHSYPIIAILGILFLIAGYTLALNLLHGKNSLWYTIGFSPIASLTLISIVIGTIFFIYSFLPYVCQIIKKQKKLFYKANTIIVIPKFMHRIRSNAKSLILLILLTAGTVSIFGATTLSLWYPYQSFKRIIPSAMEYRIIDEQQHNLSLQALAQTLENQNYQLYQTTIIKVPAVSENLPFEYDISKDKGRIPSFDCISETDYFTLLTQQGKEIPAFELLDSECILIKYHPDHKQSDRNSVYYLQISTSETAAVTVKQTSLANPIGFANSVATLIVSDPLYQTIQESSLERVSVISINGEGMRSNPAAYETLKSIMPDNPYLVSAYQKESEFMHLNSSTFLLICFATIIFFIATGSILYFQNISAITYDKSDYNIMQKMGYQQSMIKKCIRQQIQIYYFIPYLMGLLHSSFAIIDYKAALMEDLLEKNSSIPPVLFAISIFSAIYIIYYQVTKYSCYKIIFKP